MNKDLIAFLEEFITERRKNLFHKIIESRTRYLTVVLEDIYQSQNASAVLRTCDCFGIQDVHVIENRNEYTLNPEVTLGSDKWLNLNIYNSEGSNTVNTLERLKNDGYRIVATTPHTDDVNLEDFDLSKGKTALLFGTELKGLSKEALSHADEYLKIPMQGFTESFNISVSAAIILHQLSSKLRASDIKWNLTDDERSEVLFQWLKNTIKDPQGLIDKYNAKTN
jgi:tRNA (guanosine-2'-O-)-methyltransferase